MGKPIELPVEEKRLGGVERDNVEQTRRPSIVAVRSLVIVLSLFVIHTVWFACTPRTIGSLTFEERAKKILKENPLIGETTAAGTVEHGR